MKTETTEVPLVLLHGAANPWNAIPCTPRAPKGAEDGFALFPSDEAADGVEARPAWVLQVFEGFGPGGGSACVRTKAAGMEHYLPLARVASAKTLEKKREAFAASLDCKPARRNAA
jgi:hypothetical protein